MFLDSMQASVCSDGVLVVCVERTADGITDMRMVFVFIVDHIRRFHRNCLVVMRMCELLDFVFENVWFSFVGLVVFCVYMYVSVLVIGETN